MFPIPLLQLCSVELCVREDELCEPPAGYDGDLFRATDGICARGRAFRSQRKPCALRAARKLPARVREGFCGKVRFNLSASAMEDLSANYVRWLSMARVFAAIV